METRIVGLDVVRAFAMLLGVAYHASIAFIPGIGRWYPVADVSGSEGLRIFSDTLHAFRMELFFALAGFFGHLLLEKRGAHDFLKDRVRRLGVPLIIIAPLVTLGDWLMRSWLLNQHALAPDFEPQNQLLMRPLYLWFLEYLLLFSLLAFAVKRALPNLFSQSDRLIRFPELLMLLSLLSFAIRFHLGEATPAFSWLPQLASVLHFGLFYTCGFVLFQYRAGLISFTRLRWLSAPALLALVWFFTQPNRWSASMLMLQSVLLWLTVLGFLGLAFSVREIRGRWLPFLVDASYWVYLSHFPLVMGLQVALRDVPLNGVLKFCTEVGLVWVVCLLTFQYLVRSSFLAPWLGVKRQKDTP